MSRSPGEILHRPHPGSVRGFLDATVLSHMWLRTYLLSVADTTLVAGAVYFAFVLRFDDLTPIARVQMWLPIALVPIVIRPVLNGAFRLYRHSWRYISIPEVVQVLVAVIAGTILMLTIYSLLALMRVPATVGFPRSFWILEAMLSGGAMAGIRLAPRLLIDFRLRASKQIPDDAGARTILFGAGEAGAMMARAAFRQPSGGLRPVAFLDDAPRKWGQQHAGVPVMGGLSALQSVAKATRAETVLITMPTAPGETIRRVADAALDLGLRVRTAPSLEELMRGPVNAEATRPLQPEDLLRRPPVSPEALAGLVEAVGDEVVLVTGAAGSIGSELARQLLALRPRALILLDRAEGALFELQRDIERLEKQSDQPPLDLRFVIGDITNRKTIARLLRSSQIDLIFHAAAYKHVPVMEAHPSSAVDVNIGGTLSLLDAAAASGVNRFVFVSTDKAVEPSNVMGATKRVAELLVAEMGRELGRPWVAVRFGNVLGSSGSVVPIFQKQLEAGIPLTVTHHEMTRYFMTIPEAVHLILQAASMARPADLFVLDMGEPVRVLDLARDVIRLSGHDWNRARIEFIGLRPGEKLHESLFYETEAVEPTEHPKIRRVAQKSLASSPRRVAKGLLRLAESGDELSLRRQLMAAVRNEEMQPSPKRWAAYPVGSPASRAREARNGTPSIARLP